MDYCSVLQGCNKNGFRSQRIYWPHHRWSRGTHAQLPEPRDCGGPDHHHGFRGLLHHQVLGLHRQYAQVLSREQTPLFFR